MPVAPESATVLPVSETTGSNTADRVVSILLLIGQAVVGAVLSFMGLFISMASDSCGASSTCNEGLIGAGVATPLVVVVVSFVVSLIFTIRRLAAGRMAWWIPVVGTVVSVGGLFLGFAIASMGVTPNA
jgi:uncharacterized membrane protein YhaH (DUF805 family)